MLGREERTMCIAWLSERRTIAPDSSMKEAVDGSRSKRIVFPKKKITV